MNTYDKNPKTYGVSFKPFQESVKAILKEYHIPQTILEHSELCDLYHQDRSPREVLLWVRSKTIKSAVLNLVWRDEFGKVEMQFTNNDQIRHFYALVPNLKKAMESKKSSI